MVQDWGNLDEGSREKLVDSPRTVADRHYVIPSDKEFFESLDWLRGRVILGAE